MSISIQTPDRVACGKRGESLFETKFRRCVTESEPVGEASCAGKLPQSPARRCHVQCISLSTINKTQDSRPKRNLPERLPSIRPTLGTLRHRTPYYSSLVKTFRSRHTTRANTPSHSIPRRPLVPGALYNAIVRSARRHISLRVHSSICISSIPRLHTANSIPCPRSLGKPPASAR
jgi:hypothetical protein